MTYYDFPASDTSSIAVAFETYHTLTHIEAHMHRFYEFALVTRGTCTHSFRGVEAPLIVGDVFIIPPHEAHGYTVHPNTSIANCYFFPERLGQLTEYVHGETFQELAVPAGLSDVRQQWDSLLETISLRTDSKKMPKSSVVTDNLSKQGVLHLDPAAAMDVEALLMRIHEEHINFQYESEYMKSAALQMILVIFKRTRFCMPQKPPAPFAQKKQLILNSLIFLENNYSSPLTVKEIADASSLSESYFRTVFKEATGLSPLDYLNWLRVVKALEYLQSGKMLVSDAAARVGILDANYFSRLFKKLMGQPPNFFKKSAISNKQEV